MQPKPPNASSTRAAALTIACMLGFIGIFAGSAAHAWQCPPGKYTWQVRQIDAVYLGTYKDLQGHQASYFWSPKQKQLIGPLDHQLSPKPEPKAHKKSKIHRLPRRGRRRKPSAMGALPGLPQSQHKQRWRPAPPKGWKLGSIGRLRLASVHYTLMRKHRKDGFFLRFRATAKQTPLAALLATVKSPFVAGLLLGKYATQASAQAHFKARKDRRGMQAYLMLGISYSATGPARSWLKKYRYRDVGGFSLQVLMTMARQGVQGLAKLPDHKHPQHWSDYLPMMSRLWKAGKRKQMEPQLDRALRQYGLPSLPSIPKPGLQHGIRLFRCPPYRAEVRGPFQVRTDLSRQRIWMILARKSPRFAKAFGKLFQGVQAGNKAFVVAKFRNGTRSFVLLRNPGQWKVLQLSASQHRKLKIGTPIRYVARGKWRKDVPFLPKLRSTYLSLKALSGTPKLYLMPRDILGMLKPIKSQARSGSAALRAGLAVHVLYHLTKAGLAGWKLRDFRKYMWSLPGNRYRRPWRWLSTWQGILRFALIYNLSPDFADEVVRAIPQLLLRMQQASPGASKSPGGIVVRSPRGLRRFVVQVTTQAALTHLAHGRVRQADALLQRVAKRGASFVPKGMRWDPGRAKDNDSAMLRAARVLVIAHTSRMLPPTRSKRRSGHDAALLRTLMYPYKKSVQRRWFQHLHRAGYPLYRP